MELADNQAARQTIHRVEDGLVIVGAIVLVGAWWLLGMAIAAMVAFPLGICFLMLSQQARSGSTSKTAAMLIAIASFALTAVFLAGWLLFGIGPIYSTSRWPEGLQAMASAAHADYWDIQAETVEWGFLDAQHVWRIKLPPENLAAAVATHGMSEVQVKSLPFGFPSAFPPLWRPTLSTESRCFATTNFSDIQTDGDSYFAVYSPLTQTLSVWHRYRF